MRLPPLCSLSEYVFAGWIRMKTLKVVSAASLAVVLASCAVEKSSTPLSPTVAGPIARQILEAGL